MRGSFEVKSWEFLGVRADALTVPVLNELIRDAVWRNERLIIAHQNLHSLYLLRRDPKLRELFGHADHVHVDGMSLIFLGKLFGVPLRRCNRVTYVDWLDPLLADAIRLGWRIFYLGSRPGVANKGAEILRGRYPGLEIETAHGYFDARKESKQNRAVLDAINAYHANVLLVGMGMPRQEHWVLENLSEIRANAILTAGATIDYVAEVIATPPRWSGRLGLEWFFRLADEPIRLWSRYFMEPLALLGPICLELFKTRARSSFARTESFERGRSGRPR